jgi:hypothetical protein
VSYLESQNYKKESFKRKFTLQEVLSDSTDYLIEQIKDELPSKPLRNGSQIRIRTIKVWCELIEKHNKKLDRIYDLILDIKEGANK